MKIILILSSLLSLGLLCCQNKKINIDKSEVEKKSVTDFAVDHFNIWVNNPIITKQRLNDIGFTSVPDSLSDVHHGQGTSGRYFYFLNTYLELIFVYDQNELEANNRENPNLDFTERANYDQNDASPFSIALRVKDYDIDKIPFDKIRYHQEWMEENFSIYAAKNSKNQLKEPSIFVIYPEMEYKKFGALSDLDTIPEEYAFVGNFYRHPNGAKKLSSITITSTDIDLKSETMQALKSIENVNVKIGHEHLMELYFDDHIQGKSFDLRPELPLKIYL